MPAKIILEKDLFTSMVKQSNSIKELCDKFSVTKFVIIKNIKYYNLSTEHFTYKEPSMETFLEIIENSESIEECIRKMNKGRRRFFSLVKKYNISIDHFKRKKSKETKSNITKEEMINIINNNNTIYKVFDFLGLAQSKENMAWIKSFCKNNNIDISSYFNINWNDRNDVLESLKSVKYNASLKINLIKYGYLPNECQICGQKPIHNNLPLTLQCHHIDGNRANNLLENLQILCPNCHTQTDSYAKSNK